MKGAGGEDHRIRSQKEREGGRDGEGGRGKRGREIEGGREGEREGGDGGREVRSQKEREGGSAFLHKKMQNNIYLIVSNQAHEHIRQKGSISNQKQSKQI